MEIIDLLDFHVSDVDEGQLEDRCFMITPLAGHCIVEKLFNFSNDFFNFIKIFFDVAEGKYLKPMHCIEIFKVLLESFLELFIFTFLLTQNHPHKHVFGHHEV